jgi:hypothetical protein
MAALQQAAQSGGQSTGAVIADLERALAGEAPEMESDAPIELQRLYARVAELTLHEPPPEQDYADALEAWRSGGSQGARPQTDAYFT